MEREANTNSSAAMQTHVDTSIPSPGDEVLSAIRLLNKDEDNNLDFHFRETIETYPDEVNEETAMRKYIRDNCHEGVFFLDDDQERCKYGPAIHIPSRKYAGYRAPRQFTVSNGDRNFLFYSKKLSLRDVDRPRRDPDIIAAAHPSERGWNLARTHPRHISKLAQEVRDLIWKFVLTPQNGSRLQPMTVTSNWKTEYRKATICYRLPSGYEWRGTDALSTLKFIDAKDEDGPYKEIRPVHRAVIDATLLRTCKDLYAEGNVIIYGQNEWYFSMVNPYRHSSPPSLIRKGDKYEYIDPEILYPNPAEPEYPTTLAFALKQIKDQVPFHELIGCVYYDFFLRFLHTIGCRNAYEIKTLRFGGICNLHTCYTGPNCFKECCVDLVMYLRFYIPFIKIFCPNWHPEGRPKSQEEAMLPFFLDDVRKLSSLKNLQVIDEDTDECPEFAHPTVDWFKDRAAEKAREDRRGYFRMQILEAKAKEENIHCGFCGEGHVWANCYNLCKFCGEFGHFSKTCPNTDG
ncbi:hypothetical protein VTL71DRAFT_3219 [Oculimacula yallundae]|uniref:CCHC-type domain-containing protein n=1 Tax=Oculimacula yallundae TaxID=86028 RepID=A0ABR4C6K8_9HELO